MPIAKRYLRSRPVCKVTLSVPKEASDGSDNVVVVGEFNEWSRTRHPLKRLKNGSYKITLDLEVGREYQYRFLLGNDRWENDWQADKYVASPYPGVDNSVVVV